MNFKRILPLCLTVLSLGLAACVDNGESTPEAKHQHTYATEWSKDSTHHWHPCTGEGCEVVNDREAHNGGTPTCTTKAVCEDCGESYGEVIAHTYDQKVVDAKYLKSEATHLAKSLYYFSCVCGDKGTTTFEVGETVAHSKAEAWSSNSTNHWKACTATGCEDIKLDSAAHTWKDVVKADYLKDAATCTTDAVYYKSCEVCGVANETQTFTATDTKVAHTYDETTWGYKEADGHAHVCTADNCNAHDTPVAHNPGAEATEDDPQLCTDCGYILAPATGHIVHTADTAAGIKYDETSHWYNCIGCSDVKVNLDDHAGGEASCTTKAVCSVCKQPYGSLAQHSWTSEVAEEYLVGSADCDSYAVYKKSCGICGLPHETETFENADGGYVHALPEGGYLITTVVSGKTLYLEIIKSGTFTNVVYVENPSNYWTYDTTLNTFVMNVDGTDYFYGTSNTATYKTFSACKVSNASSSYIGQLYTAAGTVVTSFTVGTEYQLGMVCSSGLVYATGAMDGYYYQTTSTNTTAAKVVVSNVTWAGVPFESDVNSHWKPCANCNAKVNEDTHTGGTATCLTLATCELCGVEYGQKAEHVYGETYTSVGSDGHAYVCTTPSCGAVKEGTLVTHDATDPCSCGYTAFATEKTVTFTVDTLGLASQNYTAGTTTIDDVDVEWIQLGNYGDGIQVRDKNGNTSRLWSTAALGGKITKIEFVYSDSQNVSYNNPDMMILAFGNSLIDSATDSDIAFSTKLSLVSGQKSYTVEVSGSYDYFYFEHDLGYTSYWKSIIVYYE